ncbi:hypothetical protein F8M41_018745 [Gigaspora margarita]|uniref:Uncharacterized protein n=1 Tax=Gigaspora margarita TaxID=4874 RepID=A0A8H4EL36_GIGMA|nr:hypothetical protein F8M41_018745 [Gigaspora margarita]
MFFCKGRGNSSGWIPPKIPHNDELPGDLMIYLWLRIGSYKRDSESENNYKFDLSVFYAVEDIYLITRLLNVAIVQKFHVIVIVEPMYLYDETLQFSAFAILVHGTTFSFFKNYADFILPTTNENLLRVPKILENENRKISSGAFEELP